MNGYTPLDLRLNLDNAPWDHAAGKVVGELTIESIGLMPEATAAGRAGVCFLLKANDGTYLVAQTTLRLFNAAARAIVASPIGSEDPDD